jgi:hypothetical protein
VGQFEYTVPLSPIKPDEIEQLAKDYLAKKEKEEREREQQDES